MTTNIKAIPAAFKGVQYRSRLEARWAVFFDALGISFQYEAEGFDFDGVRYLPDFFLHDLNYWIEIKGKSPTADERLKAELLCRHTKQEVFIFAGQMRIPGAASADGYGMYGDLVACGWCSKCKQTSGNPKCEFCRLAPATHWHSEYVWMTCPECGRPGIAPYCDAYHLPCDCRSCEYGNLLPPVPLAYERAVAHRFW